ncbi:helix-turn-helix domain-containing protein [Nonomuraea sp. NPDC049269]|uniref:helix-turn-helix domain-containing protein n=1 Tax=Nonomuraea sp. NPDC049269 TaxID=3364349 RepID=UPI00371FD392
MPDPIPAEAVQAVEAVLAALPELVREVRRARGLSLRAAGDQAGCGFNTLSRVERGMDCSLSSTLAILRWITRNQEKTMPDQPNPYRERAYLVAHLAAQYFSAITYNDPNEPDWPVIYIETPAGQLSWHLSPDDLDLFDHVLRVTPDSITWDGHSTEEKYQRLAKLTAKATDA